MRSEPGSDGRSQVMVVWLGRFGLVLAAIWGFSEATVFFIVPDAIVGLIALHHPRKALWAGGAAVAGACVGGVLLYAIGSQIGDDLRGVMDAVPAIYPEMLDRAHDALVEDGGMAIVNAPSQGIPYKLYATEWALLGWGLPSLVLWTIPARAIRIVGFGILMGIAGWLFRRRIEKRPGAWTLAYGVAWAGFYAYFWFVLVPLRFG